MMQVEQIGFLYSLCNVLFAFTGTLSASPRFGSLPKVVCKSTNVHSKNENTFLLRHFKDRVSICCITVKDCPEVAHEWTETGLCLAPHGWKRAC